MARPFDVVARCPGCGEGPIRLAYPPTLWRCVCGLYFQNPRPLPAVIRSHYDLGLTYHRFQREERVRDLLGAKRLRFVRRFQRSAG